MGETRVCHTFHEPKNYEDVLLLAEAEKLKWQQAMKVELQSMDDHGVFTKTTLPPEHKATGSKWVYKRKMQINGEYRYKARLVAQGYKQRKNVHYDEFFSPAVKAESF